MYSISNIIHFESYLYKKNLLRVEYYADIYPTIRIFTGEARVYAYCLSMFAQGLVLTLL